MTVLLTGGALTLEELVQVARQREAVEIAPAAVEAMRAARKVVDRAVGDSEQAYGITTGVGVHKSFTIEGERHDRLLVRQHLIAQGPPLPHDIVRATATRLVNAMAAGTTSARPELAAHVAAALNEDRLPAVRSLGSVGQADLAQMADLAEGILDGFELAQGEAIALLNQNACSTAAASLAVHDAIALLDALDIAGALDFEGFAASRDALHPAIGEARPYPGIRATLARLGALLEGSGAVPRNLQDPLCFRTIAQVHGAARDAFGFARGQLEIELNAAQSNPLVVVPEGRVVSVGNFDVLPLATSLDLMRLALAPVLTSAAERALKLLQAPLTGLPEGLSARPGLAESALSELGIAVQAIVAEARLLAQPVSLELVSTTQAEGIEDRTTMAPLAARRLAEMIELGSRACAIELLIACQACTLRGHRLGAGTKAAYERVRSVADFVGEGDPLPDLEPLVELVREGLGRG